MRTLGITGLGLVASGKRNISPGYEWEELYETQGLVGTNPIIGGDHSDTYDTLNHMANIVLSTLIDTERVAKKLKGKTLEETLRNNWNHVYNHFQYEKDATGIEQIRRPSRSWKDRKAGIDCDCMSVVLSSLLHHQGITHAFRKTVYNEETGWQHVYVIVPKKGVSATAFTGAKPVSRNKYYVLDCVVDKFDYEVSFLKKFDKVMKVQYLNGLDAATINGGVTPTLSVLTSAGMDDLLSGLGCEFDGLDGIAGLDGLDGNLIANAFLHGLKKHLVNTRAILRINPTLTQGIYDPALFADRLDLLIDAFDNPQMRDKVLGDLARLEDQELSGLGSANGLGFFKKVRNVVKKAADKVGSGIKKAADKVGEGVKKAGQAVVKAAKAVGKFIVRYNPLTIAIRNGLLLAMKINLFRQAEKLGYGLWDEATAQSKGLNLDEFRKNKKAYEKVRSIYKKLGGKVGKLDSAIKKGWEKGVKKHNLVHGLDAIPARRPSLLNRVSKSGTQKKAVATARTQIVAASPILKAVENALRPVNFKAVQKTKENTALQELFQALRTNRSGLATKLSFAYKPSREASRYNRQEYAKYLRSAREVENLVKKHGGKPEELREAVEAGKKVAITKAALGEPATASTAAASGVIATIASFLKNINFSKLFQGKADSPHADESQVKNVDVREDLDDETFDEGDPDNKPEPMEKILSTYTDTSSIVEKITSNPTPNTFLNLLPSKAKEVVNNLSNSEAAKLYNQIRTSPAVKDIINTPLAQEVIGKVGGRTQVSQGSDFQEANVVSSRTLDDGKRNNAVKYVAIAGGAGLGLFLLYKAFNKPAAAPKAEAAPAPMSGVKTKKSKSARKTAKVMAITI